MKPLGDKSFEELHTVFKEQISSLAKGKPDFIILETFSDLGEIRAALLAAKDVCDIPVICCLTYDGIRTLTGVSPSSAAVILESLGASAVGANCSGGPRELFSVVKELSENTTIPVLVQPNAGLPILECGCVSYPLDDKDFINAIEPYFDLGITLFGSCCGSTPKHTNALKNTLKNYDIPKRNIKVTSTLASREKVVKVGGNYLPKIIGERINPTARKKLAQSLRDNDFGILQKEAYEQINSGSHLLDINIGTHGIDEKITMEKVIHILQQNVDVPLVIDTTDPIVLEIALKNYHGKALVNSVNGEKESLETILPLVKRYGAGVIGLTLDDDGIPNNVETRIKIAKNIVKKCEEYNIPKQDIYIDVLALTVGTGDNAAIDTLKGLKQIKEELCVNTVLGVSNVSHGLPNRNKVNKSFLAMAILNGLDLAILNPLEENIIDTWESASLLCGRDSNARNYIERNRKVFTNEERKAVDISVDTIKDLVIRGSYEITSIAQKLLNNGVSPITIINEGLISGLKVVGDKFEAGEYYLPQLMLSAEIAQNTFALLESYLGDINSLNKKGTIVIGTVKGDVHDIGKNMVGVMLKPYGYKVVDLGKNVPKEIFLEKAIKENADFIGLSALMTTTMTEIPNTIEYIKNSLPDIKIIVGGAAVTEDYAKLSGADGYSGDAVGAVKLIEILTESRKQKGVHIFPMGDIDLVRNLFEDGDVYNE
jgi:5-methyltetrahydrofolate--homocysteine methyltransferase